MTPETVERLRGLVRAFYEGQAGEAFSATRVAPWEGFAQLRPHLPTHGELRVLDLGCGNGRFLGWLQGAVSGRLRYVGVDQSQRLLQLCAQRYPQATFVQADLLHPDPKAKLPECIAARRFDLVCLFGLLHHVPTERERARLLALAGGQRAAGGLLVVTFWRFDRDPRWQRRRCTRAEILRCGLQPEELEPGDHLLRFGHEARLRYCHLADDAEIARLTRAAGGRLHTRFAADGAHRQNDYLVLQNTDTGSDQGDAISL